VRTFALELKEQLAQTLTTFVTSILTEPHRRLDAESAVEPPLRQIIDVLEQAMFTYDAEKLAISAISGCSVSAGRKTTTLYGRKWLSNAFSVRWVSCALESPLMTVSYE
jgi:hypothetical protein